jgi:hypothetical protein
MPIPGARYGTMTTSTGKKVRLAFRGGSRKKKTGTVVEAKNLGSGATHTPAEFATDRAKAKRRPRANPAPRAPRQASNPGPVPQRMAPVSMMTRPAPLAPPPSPLRANRRPMTPGMIDRALRRGRNFRI